MADGDTPDESQKTEEPSQKRIDDARKKGQVAFSREVNNFFLLLAFCIILIALAPYLMKWLAVIMMPFVSRPEDFNLQPGNVLNLVKGTMLNIGTVMLIPFAITVTAALLAGGLQTRFNFSTERVMPKLEKISLLKGIKRMFSLRNFVEFLKGIIKISIVGLIAYLAVYAYMDRIRLMPAFDISDMITFLYDMSIRIAIGVTAVMLVIAGADFAYQRFEYMKNLRMTQQEVKDEHKQQEGDPQIKAKLRQIRAQRARNQMMTNVPQADVVITNPTHFAIALAYDPETMEAPVVKAKGQDKVAKRIKTIAEDNKIPVFRNPPVARALFDNAEIDEEIPLEYYEAVAKIIGYVYKMQGKRRSGS